MTLTFWTHNRRSSPTDPMNSTCKHVTAQDIGRTPGK
jgi:hypothetical protein